MPKTANKKALKPRSKKKAEPTAAAEVPVGTAGRYVIGSRVSHRMFGDGTVTAVVGDKLLIKFKDGHVKQIVDYFVKHRGR